MKKVLLFAATVLLVAAPLMTANAQEGPAVMLHVGASVTKNACTAVPATCSSLVSSGESSPTGQEYNVYLLAIPGPAATFFGKVSGFECGIWYETGNAGQNLQVFGWQLCADQEFPETAWPGSRTNNTVTWTSETCNAQDGELAVAGYFQVSAYAPALMSVIPRTNNGKFTIAKCPNGEVPLTYPDDAGWASFGGRAGTAGDTDGCNACVENCAAVPVEKTTWGKIKSQYSQGD